MAKETYAEAGVKQKGTAKTTMIRIGLIALVFVTVLISQLASWLYVVPVLAFLGTLYIFPRLNLEYEYIYVDGQIDFDRIMGGAKRKTVLSVDMENVEIVAPSKSDELLAFSGREGLVTKDYSSRQPDSRTYTMIVSKDGKLTRIIFEPTAKFLECMKGKSPRKVKEY